MIGLQDTNTIKNTLKNKELKGKVEYYTTFRLKNKTCTELNSCNNFKIKDDLNNASSDTTVNLIKSSKEVIASGITDNNGNFTLFNSSSDNTDFSPPINEPLILESVKRIDGNNNKPITLRTMVKWNGSNWESLTKDRIFLNSFTTSLSILIENTKFSDINIIFNSLTIDGKNIVLQQLQGTTTNQQEILINTLNILKVN